MAAAALALYVTWLAVAFGLRTVVHRKRHGDTGLRMGKARDPIQRWSSVGFVAALALGLAAPVAALLGLDALAFLQSDGLRWVGVAIALAGMVGTVVSQASMGGSWRIGVAATERTTLITEGAFAVVRNPFFSATFATGMGLALMVGNWLSLVAVALLLATIESQVRLVEEPYLIEAHGDEFRAYARRVGRFAPGLGLLP